MKLLGVIAHADDEVTFAGFASKVVKEDGKVIILCLTGNKKRKKEFYDACKKINAQPLFIGIKNKKLRHSSTKKETDYLIRLIKKFKPDALATISDLDYHPEHKKVIEIIKEAVEFASHGEKNKAWFVEKVLMFESTNLFPYPDYLIDIAKEYENKENLMKCYLSQLTKPYKKNYYLHAIKKRAELRGIQAGAKYAEACKEIKFPIHGNFYGKDRTIRKTTDFK
ncbi:hypothetical protein HOD29_04205 [archaeon]|jgi:LmbE family N-acetylglucosaminyl deacetylase|nr:hypothetical protein [archaeon]